MAQTTHGFAPIFNTSSGLMYSTHTPNLAAYQVSKRLKELFATTEEDYKRGLNPWNRKADDAIFDKEGELAYCSYAATIKANQPEEGIETRKKESFLNSLLKETQSSDGKYEKITAEKETKKNL
ncbi:7210_t:CDS:2, partial [Entrophospora sp. SA101]